MNTRRYGRLGFTKWWLAVLLFFCTASFAVNQFIEPLFEDGFEELPFQLDCEKLNYPCSLADANPEALTRALALLDELWDIREGGSLDDCFDHLTSQPDVLLIFRGEHSLSFQVEGMMPVVFHEIPPPPAESMVQTALSGDSLSTLIPQAGPAKDLLKNPVGSFANSANPVDARPMRVVGEDRDGNGIIDQRDGKKAWLLSPYEWLSSAESSLTEIAAILGEIPDYADNVTVVQNLLETDDFVNFDFWLSLSTPDLLVISTFTGEGQIDGAEESFAWISTGYLANDQRIEELVDRPEPVIGMTLVVHFSDSEIEDPSIRRRFAFSRHFVSQENQPDSTDPFQLMVFSNDPIPPQFNGFFRHVPRHQSVSFKDRQLTPLFRKLQLQDFFWLLAKGINVKLVLGEIPWTGIFSDYSESGDDARIKELPRLMFDGSKAPLGFPLFTDVTGVVGDATNDNLRLTVQIDGVIDEERDNFAIRYRIADQPVPGIYNLASASKLEGPNLRWEVEHDLDLGFPLQSGLVPIEIIVELPEGGESRYFGAGNLAECWFYAKFTGDVSGSFSGPAGFNFDSDGKLGFEFKSIGWFWLPPVENQWEAYINTQFEGLPPPPPPSKVVEVSSAALGLSFLGYWFQPLLGDDFTCDSCGGALAITNISGDNLVSGIGTVKLIRPPNGGDPPGYEPTVELDFLFKAAKGELNQSGTPYSQCSANYDP